MIEHLAVAIVSAIAFLGAILLYGAFSPRRLEGDGSSGFALQRTVF